MHACPAGRVDWRSWLDVPEERLPMRAAAWQSVGAPYFRERCDAASSCHIDPRFGPTGRTVRPRLHISAPAVSPGLLDANAELPRVTPAISRCAHFLGGRRRSQRLADVAPTTLQRLLAPVAGNHHAGLDVKLAHDATWRALSLCHACFGRPRRRCPQGRIAEQQQRRTKGQHVQGSCEVAAQEFALSW